MIDLTQKSQKIGAKFGLSVTLFVFLAACSHKAVSPEAENLNPIPANQVLDSQYTPSADSTPVTKRSAKLKRGKKKTRLAVHKHKKSKKKALALAQVESQLPPPSQMMPPSAPVAEMNPILPAPPISPVVDTATTSSRGWLIWVLVAGFAGTLVLGYRASQKGKKDRRLVYNS